MDRFEEMRVFASVVEMNGFTKAGHKLGISRPAVSRHVMLLEQRLGVALLHRTTRRVSVTAAGQTFYDRATEILSQLELVEQMTGATNKAPAGELRVLTPVNFGLLSLGEAVTDLLIRYPLLSLSLTLSDRPADPVASGYDLAIRVGNPQAEAQTSLTTCPITTSKRIICASPDYLESKGVPRTPQDLTRHRCLSYSYNDRPDVWHFATMSRRYSVRVSGPIVTSAGQVLKTAAVRALGIAYGPLSFFENEIKSGALVRVLADFSLPEVSIYSVFPARAERSANVLAFNRFMIEYFLRKPHVSL